MAGLEKKGRRFLLVFRLNGSRYKKLPVPTDQREAEAIAAKVERRIEMLERSEWQLPDPAQVADSLIGELTPRPVVDLPTGKTLSSLVDEYTASVSNGSMESNTLLTLRIHLNHLQQVLGKGVFHLSHGLGLLDALIAACEVGRSATLYAFHVKHYSVVPGLLLARP